MKRRMRRVDFKKELEWREWMRRHSESGESVRRFCRRQGLKESAFYWWRRELARRGQKHTRVEPPCDDGPSSKPGGLGRSQTAEQPHDRARFLPLQVVMNRTAERALGVEIVLANGRIVRVRPGFDPKTLADVLAVLEARPC